ncbi:hypothetical protein FM106_12680 [Brachybacterium faecium]|nr:hypothetical protein FM106_12680 [Brachybacterium faecium]
MNGHLFSLVYWFLNHSALIISHIVQTVIIFHCFYHLVRLV